MYWMQYIEIMYPYLEFTKSISVGDIDAYIEYLPKLSNSFFTLNHLNYSRWTVQYHNNLLLLKKVIDLLSTKRTSKAFSCFPIDLTSEQTINNDAANQRSGISSLTNSIPAPQRLVGSHYLRMWLNVIIEDNACVTKLKDMIKWNLNPFNREDKGHLFNLATGKSVSKETENFFLNIVKIGNSERTKFIDDCIEFPARFHKKIKQQVLKMFATENGRIEVTRKDRKLTDTCLIRDLFGSILYISLE